MGADGFLVCYGLRWEIDGAMDDEIALLEKRQDSRQIAARTHPLDAWWGCTAVEGKFFLLLGSLVGTFGWEGRHFALMTDAEAAALVQAAKEKLRSAGFLEEPAWHFQFVPDY